MKKNVKAVTKKMENMINALLVILFIILMKIIVLVNAKK